MVVVTSKVTYDTILDTEAEWTLNVWTCDEYFDDWRTRHNRQLDDCLTLHRLQSINTQQTITTNHTTVQLPSVQITSLHSYPPVSPPGGLHKR